MLKLTDGKRNYIIKEQMMGEKEIKNKAMLNFKSFLFCFVFFSI